MVLNNAIKIYVGANPVKKIYCDSQLVWNSLPTPIPTDYTYTIDATTNTAVITGYIGAGGDIMLPDTLGGVVVAKIIDKTFYNNSNITSMFMPNSIIEIGNTVCQGCTRLKNIKISDNIATIRNYAFAFTIIDYIYLPPALANIGNNIFWRCYNLSANSVKIDSNNQNFCIYNNAMFNKSRTVLYTFFLKNSPSTYSVPIGTQQINNVAFNGNQTLISIYVPDSMSYIDGSAFASCPNLTTITINKPQDSISGAPWGATNAQIIWTGGDTQ